MGKLVYLYFGENLFSKLSPIREFPIQNYSLSSNAKVFSSLNCLPTEIISKVNLGWSCIFYHVGQDIYYSGYLGPKNEYECYQKLRSTDGDFETSCGYDYTVGITKNQYCYYFFHKDLILHDIILEKNYKIKNVVAEDKQCLLLSEDGIVLSIKPYENISVKKVDIPMKIKAIACGKEHVLLLTSTGAILSFGGGNRGQLGHGSIENQDKPILIDALDGLEMISIAAGGWHSAAMSRENDLYMWGWNESGQLGSPCMELHGDTTSMSKIETTCCLPKIVDFGCEVKVIAAACGSRHTVAWTEDNSVWTWGWNAYGQLGHEKFSLSDKPEMISLPKDFVVKDVQCKFWSTLISGTITS